MLRTMITGHEERSPGARNSEDRTATRMSSPGFCLDRKCEHRPSLIVFVLGVSTCRPKP